MSKKHFVALAEALKQIKPVNNYAALIQWNATNEKLADFCQQQNSNFNRERWLGYIYGENGPNDGEVKGK